MDGIYSYFLMHLLLTISLWLVGMKSIGHKKTIYIHQGVVFLLVVSSYLLYMFFAVHRKIYWNYGGGDAYQYKILFEEAACGLVTYFRTHREEILYKLIIWGFRAVTDDYRVFLCFVHSVMFLLFTYYSSKISKYKNSIPGLIGTILLSSFLLLSFCLQRTIWAMGILIISFLYFEKKKWITAFGFAIIALLIHSSSIIILIAYCVLLVLDLLGVKNNIDKLFWILIAAILEYPCALIATIVFLPNSIYKTYLEDSGLALGTYTALVLIVGLYLYESTRTVSLNTDSRDDLNLQLLMCSFLVFPIQIFMTNAYRMLLLFSPLMYNIISVTCERSMHQKKPRLSVIEAGVITILVLYMLLRLYQFYTKDFTSYRMCPLIIDWSQFS